MKTVKIAELKNNLSRYVEYVRGGGTVLVFDRNDPVAQIIPLQRAEERRATEDEERLTRLERRGLIRRGGAGGVPHRLGRRKLPRVRGSVLQDLLSERESGW
jgi:prevent-host-death family protein